MQIRKRFFSVLLSLIMVFSLLSMSAISASGLAEGNIRKTPQDLYQKNFGLFTKLLGSDEPHISVTMNWDDADNQDGIRPENVTVRLLANGQDTNEPLVLSAENNWTDSFTNLPPINAGVAINYTVEEAVPIAGYTAEVSGDAVHGFSIQNTHTPATVNIRVEKVWNDFENQDGKRPQSISAMLIANKENMVDTIVLSQDNHWKGEFANCPEYKDGEKIEYSIQEVAIGEYHCEISGDAANGFVITNTYTPGIVEVPVTVLWQDAANQDGKRPENISVKLIADNKYTGTVLVLNSENNWSGKFKNLPEYKSGNKISYTITEITEAMDGYSVQISGNASEGYVLTNSYTPSVINISVKTFWNDSQNQDGKRPDYVNVLLLANDVATDSILKLSESNEWNGKFEKLPEYSAGQKIIYKVTELTEELKDYTGQISGTVADGFVITNSHTPSTISLSVKKVWNDLANEHGKRPNSVVITLLADNVSTGKTLELNQSNSWAGKFEKLPEYKTGKQVKYTISEVGVKDYESKITGSSATGFVVTNTFIQSKVSLSVKNVWNDNNDSAKIRPSRIKVILVADGKDTTQTLELSAANSWSGSFNNLDKLSKGKLIKYTVREAEVKGYSYAVTGSAEKGYTITNTYKTSSNNTNGNTSGNKTTPDTGDYRNLMLWVVLLIVSCCGIFAVTVAGTARKKHK